MDFTQHFPRIKALPTYAFNVLQEMKASARAQGQDIIDMGMGNPDLPTPYHIVEKMQEATMDPRNHRYSLSRGLPKLREAICEWYARKYSVNLDPETQAVVTIGAKEGISHLVYAILAPEDGVLVPDPTYPIHHYSVMIAGGRPIRIPLFGEGATLENFADDFLARLKAAWAHTSPAPRLMILSFPHNPTTAVVDLAFFEKIIAFAREKQIMVIHDLAYADLTFDGYRAPSLLQVPGAMDVAVELYSMSKGYNMPGWRVGFVCGNPQMVGALTRLKSYFDYGIFQPIQIAAIVALRGPDDCVEEVRRIYEERRDVLVEALQQADWPAINPKGTMFVWTKIPERLAPERLPGGSLEFAKRLLNEAKVMASPGIGFGPAGEGYIRFALVENCERIRQAGRGIKKMLQNF